MTKRIVLAFGLTETKVDPQFCPHTNAFTVSEHGESWLECPDCNSRIFEDGEVQQVGEGIPIFEEEL